MWRVYLIGAVLLLGLLIAIFFGWVFMVLFLLAVKLLSSKKVRAGIFDNPPSEPEWLYSDSITEPEWLDLSSTIREVRNRDYLHYISRTK